MDGTEVKSDALPKGQPSAEIKGTPKVETKTYTEEEVNKRISDALAAKGRDAKTLSDREAILKAERETIEADKVKIADWQRQRDETELAEARRDPDKLAAWQKKQNEKSRDAEFATREAALKKREADLTKREAEHSATIQAAQETQLEIELWEIGAKYGINPVILKDTMKDLNLTTTEQAEALAKRLSGTAKRPAEGEAEEKEEFTPISGVTTGGGKLTQEQLDKLSMPDYAAYRKKEDSKQL
jgi:hypothetical protein